MTDDTCAQTVGSCPTCKTVLRRTYSLEEHGIRPCSLDTVSDLSLCMACGEAIVFDGRLRLARQSDIDAFGTSVDVVEILRLTLRKLRTNSGRLRQ